jgi:hypothetical protein
MHRCIRRHDGFQVLLFTLTPSCERFRAFMRVTSAGFGSHYFPIPSGVGPNFTSSDTPLQPYLTPDQLTGTISPWVSASPARFRQTLSYVDQGVCYDKPVITCHSTLQFDCTYYSVPLLARAFYGFIISYTRLHLVLSSLLSSSSLEF